MGELHEAAYSGELSTLRECLRAGFKADEPDPEWGGKTPLHIACARGRTSCVSLLLDCGADVNALTDYGWSAAHYACETGQVRWKKISPDSNS